MIFLEYVACKLLGSPGYDHHWECPYCGRERFSIRPHRPEYKDRFRCWKCDSWGDASDLLKAADPVRYANYQHRIHILSEWRKEFEMGDTQDNERSTTILFRGLQGSCTEIEYSRNVGYAADEIQSGLDHELSSDEVFSPWLLIWALGVAQDHEVELEDVVVRINEEFVALAEMAEEHADSCNELRCGVSVCRLRRGLEPLTAKQWQRRRDRLRAAARAEDRRRKEFKDACMASYRKKRKKALAAKKSKAKH